MTTMQERPHPCTHLWVGREKEHRDDPPGNATTVWRCQECRQEFDLDLPAARPVVDAARLTEVLHEREHTRWPCLYETKTCGHLRIAREKTDAILASGVVQDAADVRRAVAEEIEAEARAALDLVTDPATARTLYNDGQVEALGRFLRIAREAGERS